MHTLSKTPRELHLVCIWSNRIQSISLKLSILSDEVRRFFDSEEAEKVCVTLNRPRGITAHTAFIKLDRVIFVVWSDKDKKVYQ